MKKENDEDDLDDAVERHIQDVYVLLCSRNVRKSPRITKAIARIVNGSRIRHKHLVALWSGWNNPGHSGYIMRPDV